MAKPPHPRSTPDRRRVGDSRPERLADEQAALRRVATLVARGAGADDLFAAVSNEVGRLFEADAVVARFEPDGSAMVVVGLTDGIPVVTIGTRWKLENFLASTVVYRTGRPARNDHTGHRTASGAVADSLRQMDFVSTVAAPIMVEGRVWGVMTVSDKREPLPSDTEERVERFTELVATAIANAESRAAIRELVDEQAALRRIATLVAEGSSPQVLFDAVAVEAAEVLRADQIAVIRSEPGAEITVVAYHGRHAGLDSFPEGDGSIIQNVPDMRTGIGTPVVVDGRVWGTITGGWLGATPAPPDAEQRLTDFAKLLALAIANADSRAELAASEATARELAREQVALRRVATLVARGVSSDELFSGVSREVGDLFGAEAAVARFEADGPSIVTVGQTSGIPFSVGSRIELEEFLASTKVYRTGRAARNDTGYISASGPTAERIRQVGFHSTVGAPIVVQGALWGVILVARVDTLPSGSEERIERFSELVATAIANAESRAELAASQARARHLAEEQAALRRVATLVAKAAKPEDVFAAVANEIEAVLDIEVVTICRCEPDGFEVISSRGMPGFPAGSRWPWDVPSLPGLIYRTGRPARIDDFTHTDGLNAAARAAGVTAAVGVPIVVGGNAWGSMCAASTKNEPFPPDTEDRLARFTDLVATSVSNAIMRAELAASRVRVIASADDARRRIERDLHDGAQQRLVTLAVALRRVEGKIPADLNVAKAEVTRVIEGLQTAVEELRELSRGIHPSILTEGGLSPALKALGRRSPVRVKLDVGFEDRLSDNVEVAAYYTVSEALTNASKHASATRVWVSVNVEQDMLHLSVRDDGVGGADASRGSGLTGLRDRIEALGGKVRIESPPETGTHIEAEIPLLQSLDRHRERETPPSPAQVPPA